MSVARIVLATGNAGKLRELRAMLPALDVVSLDEFTAESAEETGLSFVENAILKARHACTVSGLPAIADDSGLEVDALGGAPGIYSARYAGTHGDDRANIEKLLADLDGRIDRGARFRCVIAAMRHATDPAPLICEGAWEGEILGAPRGDNGFGYDPVFRVMDTDQSAAELTPEEKNRRSHRGQALALLKQRLATNWLVNSPS